MRKVTAKTYCATTLQLRKNIVASAKQVQKSFYTNVCRRLLKVCYEAYNMETLL
jgi:hypothetical protein